MASPPRTDASRCPLCARENACALARGDGIEVCWCASQRFPPSLLARVPDAQRGVACICRTCLEEAQAREAPPSGGDLPSRESG